MLSINNKYLRYFAIIIVLGVFIYAIYTYYYTSPSRQGTEFEIYWSLNYKQVVYDLNLPNDLNYTRLWGNQVIFNMLLNISEYTSGTKPEQVFEQFSNKQSIRSWIDSMKAPNLLKNMLKSLFDMSKEDIETEIGYGEYDSGFWHSLKGASGYVEYRISRTQDLSNNYITVKMGDGDPYTTPERAWELLIRVPFTGTDYDLTFMRYPKP